MNDDPLLLTVPETARLLRISRNLAYELVARGELPSVRFGRVIRIPRSVLADWVRESGRPARLACARGERNIGELLTERMFG